MDLHRGLIGTSLCLAFAPIKAGEMPREYVIAGTNADGSSYSGSLLLETIGEAYRLEWQAGSSSVGIGVRVEDAMAVAIGGPQCAVVAYRVFPEGGLIGTWSGANGRVGTERAQPGLESTRGIVGDYLVAGSNPDGSLYKGALAIQRTQDQWTFQWHTGKNFTGRGMVRDGFIAVAVGPDYCGVALYRIGTNGRLDGEWSFSGKPNGRELATPR